MGQPAVTLRIFRDRKQSPIDISEKVSKYVASRNLSLHEGIKMTIWQDSSYYLQGRLDMMIRNAHNGLILVFLVLSFFLRPSLAFFVALGLPISFMGAFATMECNASTSRSAGIAALDEHAATKGRAAASSPNC